MSVAEPSMVGRSVVVISFFDITDGSGFKVQGLQTNETAQNIDRNPECLP